MCMVTLHDSVVTEERKRGETNKAFVAESRIWKIIHLHFFEISETLNYSLTLTVAETSLKNKQTRSQSTL